MQPRWSSIWLLLIRVPLWQRNFPLLRQFALFIELQRANRHQDTLRRSCCSGRRAGGTSVLGGQKVRRVTLQEGQSFWEGSGEKLKTPRLTQCQLFLFDQLVEEIQTPGEVDWGCNYLFQDLFCGLCQRVGGIVTWQKSDWNIAGASSHLGIHLDCRQSKPRDQICKDLNSFVTFLFRLSKTQSGYAKKRIWAGRLNKVLEY